MQTFQTKPTDADLAGLLDPEGRSIYLSVDDTAERLIVQPRGYPMWFIWACVLLPVLACAAYFTYTAMRRPLIDLENHFLTIAPFVACGAIAFFIILFRSMNRIITDRGDFFVLDRSKRTLTLPRFQLCIAGDRIQELIEVHAWHTRGDRSESSSEWLRELSVLVRSDSGGFVRYPVLTTFGGNAGRWARELAEFFHVERRALKLTWSERRRLKEERREG